LNQRILREAGAFLALRDLGMKTMGHAARAIDLDQARLDPASVFSTPHDVIAAKGLTQEDKKSILSRWEEDADALLRATDEGMPVEHRSPGELLRAVHEAMQLLDPSARR
jgi:hypothetical protein